MEGEKEVSLSGYPNLISYECSKKIINQMKNKICKIKIGEDQGTGFFCKIPFPDKNNMLPVFITNNHIINNHLLYKDNETISINIKEDNDIKKIPLNNRIKYTNEEYDITIIGIKESDKINNYLKLDNDIINDILSNENPNIDYIDKTIYIIQYPEGELSVSFGTIHSIYENKKYNFNHKCNTRRGSSGSPILNINNKVIGMHKEGIENKFNRGTFLNYPIRNFIQLFYNKNKKIFNQNEETDIKIQSLINKIIFGKYKLLKSLCQTPFCSKFQGLNMKTNELVLLKMIEKNSIYKELMEHEAYFLTILKGVGIPKLYSYGRIKNYNVSVQEFQGLNLFHLKNIIYKYHLEDIAMMGIQIMNIIEFIHSKFCIHRNIKPENFTIGYKDTSIIYLNNFELAQLYRSSCSGKHIQFYQLNKFFGTIRYASINALKGNQQSRRDDLISIGNMLIYLFTEELPWKNFNSEYIHNRKKYSDLIFIKTNTPTEIICKNMPIEFKNYYDYCKNLYFEQDPDYEYLRNLFKKILVNNFKICDNKYSWILNKDFKGKIQNHYKKYENNEFNIIKYKALKIEVHQIN